MSENWRQSSKLLTFVFGFILLCQARSDNPTGSAESKSSYRIGPQDQVSISVWQHTDLNQDVVVGPDGKITFPLIGDTQIGGLTRAEAQDSITRSLKKYLVDPVVTVNVTNYNSGQVKMLGMLTTPGVYSIKGKGTLVTAIAQAGGTNNNAQLRQVAILRAPDQIMEVDLYKILYEGQIGLDVPLEPNDTVFVPDNRNTRVFVLGYVNTPGIVDLSSRLTVLDAIMHVGGYTEGANLSDVWVVRGKSEKPEILHIDLAKQINKGIPPKNDELKPGDIVYVHRGFVAALNYIFDQASPAMRTIILGESARQSLQGKSNTINTVSQ